MLYLVAGSITQGLVYGIMALGVFFTFRILNAADLTVEGSFPLGAAVTAVFLVQGYHPLVATVLAILAGSLAGVFTGLLVTKAKITPLLSGILTMTALYSINLRVMARPNIPLLRVSTVIERLMPAAMSKDNASLLLFLIIAVALVLMFMWFLHTSLGTCLRATGDNEAMMRSLGVDVDTVKIIALGVGNALVAFSGSLVAQYQGFADIGMGIGTLVAGLASVIIGEALLGKMTTRRWLLAVVGGSVLYRLVIFVALRAGFAPTDLKLMTAVLVVLSLTLPEVRSSLLQRRARAAFLK